MKFKITINIIFLTAFLCSNAQKKKLLNLPYFDTKKIHFGFCIGISTMNFEVKEKNHDIDSLKYFQIEAKGGMRIGMIVDWHILKYLSLRLLPSYSFGERDIEYFLSSGANQVKEIKIIESNIIELPLNLKYSSKRFNNFAAYLLAGANFNMDLSSKIDVDNNVLPQKQIVKINKNSLLWDAGFGVDFFMEYFKFSIEMKVSRGFNDILIHENTMWNKPIKQLFPRTFIISINFEG